MLDSQKAKNEKKNWNRLDRGTKIQKVRLWIRSKKDEWPEELCNKAETILVRNIKHGGLTSSSSVIYDKKECVIKSMPCISLIYKDEEDASGAKIPEDILIRKRERK